MSFEMKTNLEGFREMNPFILVLTSCSLNLQVLSKGQVVYTGYTVKNSDGLSKVSLPRYLFREVSPSMRVIAYYYATLGGRSEFVVDSLLVDTDDTCIEEVWTNGWF